MPKVCKINRIVVAGPSHGATGTSNNFDVEIFEKTGGVYSVYKAVGYDATVSPYGLYDLVDFVFKNRDTVQATTLYLKITNNKASDTTVFDVEVYGTEMSQ